MNEHYFSKEAKAVSGILSKWVAESETVGDVLKKIANSKLTKKQMVIASFTVCAMFCEQKPKTLTQKFRKALGM